MDYNSNGVPARYPQPNKKLRKGLIIAAIVLFALIIILNALNPFATIPAGHTGVLTTFGKVADYTLSEGLHLKNPVAQVVVMDNRTQKKTIQLDCFSKDIQQVKVVCTVNFSIERVSVQDLYKNVGVDYYEVVMVPRIQESVKAVFTRYTAENLMSVRDTISDQIQELLSPEMKAFWIDIYSVSIEDIDFTNAFTDAVEAKQVAEQTKLKVETEQAQQVSVEEATAKRRIIEANADAEQREILAKANAEVVKIQADAAAYSRRAEAAAEAEANKMVADSITEPLIKYREIIQWNGKLPDIVAGDATLPILNLNNQKTATPYAP